MSIDHPTTEAIDEARQLLCAFIIEQAEKARAELGFGWQPDPDAPGTYADLCIAFQRSQLRGVPLFVSSLHNDVVITTPDVNLAMRFWHDVNHVQRGLTFRGVDEQQLALWHLSILTAAGFEEHGLVWQLLHADTIGQNYLLGITGSFPLDQRRFAEGCIREGFDRGVLREARRITA